MQCRLIRWAPQRGEARINDECDVIPHPGIVLNLVMRLVERAREPGVISTIDVLIVIGHVQVPDDLCPCRIFSDDLWSPAQWPFRLEEIDCRFNVTRYPNWLLPRFTH